MTQTIVRNGTVVSLDPDVGEFDEADVLIEDGEIIEVGTGLSASNAEEIDAAGKIVVPGFVDSHIHLAQTQVRGIAGDWSLMGEYFDDMLGNITGLYQPEDMYLGGLFGAFEKLYTGTTTALDWSYPNTLEHGERAVDALQDTGLRAVYTYGPPGDDAAKWWFESDVGLPEENIRALHEETIRDDDRLSLALGLRGPDFCTDETARADLELARDLGALSTVHMGAALWPSSVYGDDYQGFGAIEDMLGPDVNVAHGNHFSQEDIDHAVEQGVSFSSTPEVEMQMGHGIPVTGKVLEAGGRPAWGVDVCSNVSGDMGTQMRIGMQLQRMFDNQAVLEGDEEVTEVSISARDTLEMATIEGAKALGLDDEIGTITPGKRADLVVFDASDFMTAPCHNPVQTVVFQSDPSHIDTVLVDGEVVKRDGELTNPKVREEFDRFVASGERLLDEAGIDA
ncbi:cytosine/adenosine deaminase-related metal-dependent hydrolase [Halorubrum trapanicum]|uniref:Cytosine/adenosine deaminase-related metal-dependent hydrolase n=1 Tax=Halorubrum trapanicum TaxID=29284 RepID=A0A8J7RSZ0_9EURY|nr:amidohydrolase family protein [Halorubrum trapanicum]MBP1902997.1 cytosine/adenosine deaminase-related metal-dependent hydrolase [Halorubrum trapanicum]